jgi:HK97 family phage major capsid protein
MNLNQIRERIAGLKRECRALLDGYPGESWTPTQQTQFEAKLADIDRLERDLQAGERKEERFQNERAVAAVSDRYGTHALLAKWLRRGDGGFSDAEHAEFRNTMSTTTPAQGGYAVPTMIGEQFVDTLKAYSGVRRVAQILKTPTGNPLNWATTDGTSELGEIVVENAAAGSQDMTFGSAALNTAKYSSKIFTLPMELVQDAGIDIQQLVFDRAAARIGRLSNQHFTTGTGSGQPNGFVTAASVGVTAATGNTTNIPYDSLMDLVHSVNAEYRQDPRGGVAWMMSDTAWKTARKTKDTNGRPLYLPSDGVQPETLMGYEVVVNDDMAVPAANAKSVAFGNWRRGYIVRDALDVLLQRFDDSAYVLKGQYGFLGLARIAGNLVDTAAVKMFQHSAT